MTFKEVFKLAASTVVLTLAGCVVGVSIHMHLFNPANPKFTAAYFDQIIILSFVCGALCFILYSKKEFSVVNMRIRMAAHLLVTLASVVLLALHWRWILPVASHIVVTALCVLGAYAAMLGAIYLQNKSTANLLNSIIKKNKKSTSKKTENNEY